MNVLPEVLGATELSNGFLGNLVQVCFVTRDCRRMMEGFVRLGIGPWTIRTVDASNIEATYRGRPADFSVKVCLANGQNMNWEIIELIRGQSIYTEFLDRHGEGIQHLAFNCNGIDYDERVRQFEARGYEAVQAGTIFGGIDFHYFSAEDDLRTTVEIYRVPAGFVFPQPEEWYPAPPPGT
ncbi:VOC family protein [Mesorhizobium sp. WSM4904]|uniref:VOC family protein n=1 Tax=Mesorhizobium sp. WSM4904 TaxID=3038545 RepID=UPI00241874FB|nr:VOC family protein [Mesorhizobium sp. WSM4904]WFP61725.1 VOC family protein [Mesorhizobium sp. WSM4904]